MIRAPAAAERNTRNAAWQSRVALPWREEAGREKELTGTQRRGKTRRRVTSCRRRAYTAELCLNPALISPRDKNRRHRHRCRRKRQCRRRRRYCCGKSCRCQGNRQRPQPPIFRKVKVGRFRSRKRSGLRHLHHAPCAISDLPWPKSRRSGSGRKRAAGADFSARW